MRVKSRGYRHKTRFVLGALLHYARLDMHFLIDKLLLKDKYLSLYVKFCCKLQVLYMLERNLAMFSNRLPIVSQWMATTTLWLIVLMLAQTALTWIAPGLNSIIVENGLTFSLRDSLIVALDLDPSTLPGWQRIGAILLSSAPLLALAAGLWHLRALFQTYSRQEYFSPRGAMHLKRVGQFVALWVVLGFFCQPLLSMWLTMTRPVGDRLISVGFSGSDAVALFLAGSIAVVAKILERASAIQAENQQFI